MEKMYFNELKQELENPTHGESKFQVGHMNPLKANTLDIFSGHTAENISWISAEEMRYRKIALYQRHNN